MSSRRIAIVQRVDDYSEENLDELEDLSETAGYEVVYRMVQKRPPHPKYYIGPGKLKELKDAVDRLGIGKVIFENELKPQQEYNLAKELGVEISTRLRLILEVFSLHASSTEARLQIKLAELKYELSRAKEKVRLAKKGEQPGFHGLGAYEADVYYREIARTISSVSRKLEEVMKRKSLVRSQREKTGIPVISLAGYTNAGKSTLFNYLTRSNAEVSPKLFTTLSTKRRIARIAGRPVYVTDTVGFIKNVPTLFISAFHSTLGEIAESDLILLLLDASDPLSTIVEKFNVSMSILREIGVTNSPIIVVLNKLDMVTPGKIERVIANMPPEFPIVAVSALTGQNIEELERLISRELRGFIAFEARLEPTQESLALLNELYSNGHVLETKYDDGRLIMKAEAPHQLVEKIRRLSSLDGFRIIQSDHNS